jgi:hypothetical protein
VQSQGRGGLHQEEDGGAVQEGHREDDDNESGTKYIFLDSSTKFDVDTEFLIF